VSECPICNSPVSPPTIETMEFCGFDCARCGRWSIKTDPAGIELAFAHRVGEWNAQAVRRRSWLSYTLRHRQPSSSSRWAELPLNYFEPLYLDNQPLPSPSEQLDNLILWVGDNQPSMAESAAVSLPAISAWIGASIIRFSPGAGLGWLLEEESTQALLEDRGDASGQKQLRLKMAGWNRYEALKRGQIESRRVLMAMKFNTPKLNDPQLDQLVGALRPAVKQSGFDLYTLDDGPAGSIDDQLRVALRTSRFIIADLTYGSRGSYWEAGFSEGLGRPVIYTCRETEWNDEKPHFDTNHLRTIVWHPAKLDEAANRLKAMIRATLPAEAKMSD
jgi:hypothetical protein